jgi:hypothetical protein
VVVVVVGCVVDVYVYVCCLLSVSFDLFVCFFLRCSLLFFHLLTIKAFRSFVVLTVVLLVFFYFHFFSYFLFFSRWSFCCSHLALGASESEERCLICSSCGCGDERRQECASLLGMCVSSSLLHLDLQPAVLLLFVVLWSCCCCCCCYCVLHCMPCFVLEVCLFVVFLCFCFNNIIIHTHTHTRISLSIAHFSTPTLFCAMC